MDIKRELLGIVNIELLGIDFNIDYKFLISPHNERKIIILDSVKLVNSDINLVDLLADDIILDLERKITNKLLT